ncbi:hypothetical protein JOB18_030917 [Solea senegalensis]|uniref:Uncharacterized protein n=1 Tax=Solea senegalensis TaxID=28829 RepID=A0AAV6QA28_SOLSE|nr:hypothetical protein JOB18_030917 [Solea senegalensis]
MAMITADLRRGRMVPRDGEMLCGEDPNELVCTCLWCFAVCTVGSTSPPGVHTSQHLNHLMFLQASEVLEAGGGTASAGGFTSNPGNETLRYLCQ